MADTLRSPVVANLLARLFAEATTSDAELRKGLAGMSREQVHAAMTNPDYRGTYARLKGEYMAVSAETGRLLYMLARASNARAVVEFGTSFGLSTIHLAAAVRDNGGGRVIGSELEAAKAARARANLADAGLADLVEIREGDALDTLSRDLPDHIDLVLLDGAKVLYPRVLALVEPRLRAGALIVADNADHSPDYLARVRGDGYLSVPFAEDVELSLHLR